jgi:hypothetical protein
MEISLLQWIGYIASVAIALSMTMSSILKFRWINLFGALTFSVYGFLIGAWPVGFLNAFIALVDIYYLNSIYSKKEVFEILEVRADNRYLIRFLQFHEDDIEKFFPGFAYRPEMNTVSFFVLRNMAVAGVLTLETPGKLKKGCKGSSVRHPSATNIYPLRVSEKYPPDVQTLNPPDVQTHK